MSVVWKDESLDSALSKCQATHTGRYPCLAREYLMARHEYHKMLVDRGMLDPKLAEKRPA